MHRPYPASPIPDGQDMAGNYHYPAIEASHTPSELADFNAWMIRAVGRSPPLVAVTRPRIRPRRVPRAYQSRTVRRSPSSDHLT